ncbi:MAG: class I SAM-dependent methyltransferase [Candidatus Bathyarchaeota archaeon]|nr:MAG: class I SAM-dependent methyltransferase [Candidatus Bathyarchaeota archaeon]
MAEFDYQFENLPSKNTEYSSARIRELEQLTQLDRGFFEGKLCLDAGCGNGRYTWAMLQIGAEVHSIDISPKAIEKCRQVNPSSCVQDIMTLQANPIYDFVLCWGVLHHLANPRDAFKKVVHQVKLGGTLHIMVYHAKTQRRYKKLREQWRRLDEKERLELCSKLADEKGGDIHGWYDALNPRYNWGYRPGEIRKWFRQEGFVEITLTQKYNINMRGQRAFLDV